MKKLYIGFSKAKSPYAFLSKLIMFAQQVPFSHVYIRFDSDFLQRTFIYQASGMKVNFENINSFNSHAVVVKEIPLMLSDDSYKKVLQFVIDNVGKPYSLKQLFSMGCTNFLRMFGIKRDGGYKDHQAAFVCSEIGACVAQFAGITLDMDEDEIGPKELYDIISKTYKSGDFNG